MGCKQKHACLVQRSNNVNDCTIQGEIKTCRQCCDEFNCAARSYFTTMLNQNWNARSRDRPGGQLLDTVLYSYIRITKF